MTDNNHPITPPDELVEEWIQSTRSNDCIGSYPENYEYLVAARAARWGADQELEACCQEVHDWYGNGSRLRDARRPKPPSLKEQAIELVDRIEKAESVWAMSELDIIRRALEALPD